MTVTNSRARTNLHEVAEGISASARRFGLKGQVDSRLPSTSSWTMSHCSSTPDHERCFRFCVKRSRAFCRSNDFATCRVPRDYRHAFCPYHRDPNEASPFFPACRGQHLVYCALNSVRVVRDGEVHAAQTGFAQADQKQKVVPARHRPTYLCSGNLKPI